MTDGMDRLPGGSPMQLKRVTREARNTCDASRGVGASVALRRVHLTTSLRPPSDILLSSSRHRINLCPHVLVVALSLPRGEEEHKSRIENRRKGAQAHAQCCYRCPTCHGAQQIFGTWSVLNRTSMSIFQDPLLCPRGSEIVSRHSELIRVILR
jgi:hypothetical protein